ncbi:MAG TPA: ACP S-malonyltransferase [Lachnospiraceae bacterium]
MKVGFLFPGQGAQYKGMGKDFYESFPKCRQIWEEAARVSDLNLDSLCFEENEKLNITEYTQIAILAVEAMILQALKEEGIDSDVNAGLSLGEYGALIASGVLSIEDAFFLVRKRGIYMQNAVPRGGAMAAVLGADKDEVEEIVEKVSKESGLIVSVANYNCPGQLVISGQSEGIDLAREALKMAGVKRVLPLNVSGPFHSAMLKVAGEQLARTLKDIKIGSIKKPYLSNVTGDYVEDGNLIKELLVRQVSESVLWQQSIERMIESGVSHFIEVGPKKTLSGFMKKINPQVKICNVETVEDLKRVKEFIDKE